MTQIKTVCVDKVAYDAVLRNSVRVNDLEAENKQLRQLLKECKPLFFPYVKDMPLSRCEELNLLTRINAAIGESEE